MAGEAASGQTNQTGPATATSRPAEDIEDIDLLGLEVPTVITALRHPSTTEHLPYAVSVITAEDIRLSGARSVPDALRLAAGVDVADLTANNYAVSPRGFHGFIASQVLVLVDGRRITDAAFSTTGWGSWPFQLEDIERIEVIRGPAGATWGANATNGVINIVTKDPADQLGLTVTGGGGSRGMHKEHLGYGFADDKLRLRVSGEYEASDGFAKGGSLLRGLEDGPKVGRTGLHAIYEINEQEKLTISGGNALVDGGYPPAPAAGFGARTNSESQASFLLGKWSRQIASDNTLELTGYVNDFQLKPGVRSIDYRYQQLALELGHTFAPTEAHTITWGIESRTDLFDASNSDPFMLTKDYVSTAVIGVYVQDQWRFAPRWTLELGGRIDYEFYGGWLPSGRAALSYELGEDAVVYGSVSRALHSPMAPLRFTDLTLMNGLVRATADRDIRPQTLIAYELGLRKKFNRRLETSAALFWHSFDDVNALPARLGPPGLLHIRVDNYGPVSMYGAELDARWAVTDKLTLLGNYTYQQTDWMSETRCFQRDVLWPPAHKFMLGARYSPTADLHLSSHLYYVDASKAPNPANPFMSRHIDPYFRLDLRAEHEFWNDRASVAVGVRNLLDRNHYEGGTFFLNDAEVPRMIYAEFRMVIR